MSNITISMRIPLGAERVVSVAALQFSHWAPLENGDKIIKDFSGDKCIIYFDEKSIDSKLDEIASRVNVIAVNVNLEYHAQGIQDDLVKFMQMKDYTKPPIPELENYDIQYKELCERVYRNSIKTLNKVIGYIREIKGQYWLRELPETVQNLKSRLTEYRAKFKINENSQWHRFQAVLGEPIEVIFPDVRSFVTKDDWISLKNSVESDREVPHYKSILTSAKLLNNAGYPRSAVSESVSALEFCFNYFCDNAEVIKVKGAFTGEFSEIKKHCKKLGFLGSFDMILPLSLKDEIISKEKLKICCKAIALRNNILHNGQHNVDLYLVNSYIKELEQVCDIFYNLAH